MMLCKYGMEVICHHMTNVITASLFIPDVTKMFTAKRYNTHLVTKALKDNKLLYTVNFLIKLSIAWSMIFYDK